MPSSGSGSGYGSGDGHGYGYSYGHGDDHGDGYGGGYSDGYGYGYGHGRGYGDGYGSGYGYGYGSGSGSGYGSGYGSGSGSGDGEYTVSHDTPIVAYHYISRTGRLLREHRGERVSVEVGTVLDADPDKIEMCRYGLHASLTPEDAARYIAGTGHLLCKVACSGRIIYGADKLVCSRREVLEILGERI